MLNQNIAQTVYWNRGLKALVVGLQKNHKKYIYLILASFFMNNKPGTRGQASNDIRGNYELFKTSILRTS